MSIEAFLVLFTGSFALAVPAVVSPGPVSVAVVTEGARRGVWVGPLVSLGHAIAEIVVVVLIALGLTGFMQHPAIRLAIAVVGGLFILWMGGSIIWGALRGKLRLPKADDAGAPAMNPAGLVGLGLSATLSNPFWYTWWVTVAAGVLLGWQQELGLIAVPVFFAGHIVVDFGWNSILSTVVASGRHWLTDTAYRGLLIVTSLFLVYLGVSFLLEGGQMLLD
jgi:threonine/homoserine/homoserine lactone efflux protein